MAKPLSSAHELGRAIGYKVDVRSLLEKIKPASPGEEEDFSRDHAYLEEISRVVQKQNAGARQVKKLWIVLKIERGVPVMIDAYRDKRSAAKRERFLRQHMCLEMDQVKLFEIKV